MRKYRVNADSWTVLQDILCATPDEFNGDYSVDRSRQFPRYRNALRGRTVDGTEWIDFGRLPDEYKEAFCEKGLEYVIFSYETPIAWRTNGQWVCPDVRYSTTTSKHQGNVRTALSQISGGI